MIDENGKIGGKINLIDLLIVVVILAVIAFAVSRFLSNDDMDNAGSDPVIIEFTCAEVNDYTARQLETGVPVLDGNANKALGTAVDFTVDDATTTFVTDSGKAVLVSIPETKSVVISIEGAGKLDGNGLLIDGTRYGIGHSTVIFVGKCRLSGKISGIDPA